MRTIILTLLLSLGSIFVAAQEKLPQKAKSENQHAFQYREGIEDGKQYVITRHNGVEYIGNILQDDDHEILLETEALGKVYIPKYEIKSILEIIDNNSIMYNEYQPAGPFTTRYSFTTNALPIKKGENYGMLNLYGPELHLAVSDKLNVGLMATWIASPMVLATKYSFKKEESTINFSFGTLLGTSGYLNSFKGYGGLHWINVTFGDRKNNLTFSGGYAYLQTGILSEEPAVGVYTEDEYFDIRDDAPTLLKMSHGPMGSVAGIFKIGAKVSFVFDSMIGYINYEIARSEDEFSASQQTRIYTVIRKDNAHSVALFLMPGVRFQSTDHKALQICVAGVSMFGDSDVSFPIPMVSWFYQF